MSHLEKLFDEMQKNKHGYVPDILDFESDFLRDKAVVARLKDFDLNSLAVSYMLEDAEFKNTIYGELEFELQDEIDHYNNLVDDKKTTAKEDDVSIFDPEYKWQHFNQAEIDAGFSGTGREFC